MEGLISFINNNWVISIITGLLVAVLTDLWNRFRKKKEFLHKVKSANKEVFNSIKAFIPEDTLPAPSVLFSLQRATAKEYGLKSSDLEPLEVVFDSLIKDVMDSSFLSYQAKIINCKKLQEYLGVLIEMEMKIEEINRLRSSNSRSLKDISSPLFAGLSVTITLLTLSFNGDFKRVFPSGTFLLYGSLIGLLTSLTLVFFIQKIEVKKMEEKKSLSEKKEDKKGA